MGFLKGLFGKKEVEKETETEEERFVLLKIAMSGYYYRNNTLLLAFVNNCVK